VPAAPILSLKEPGNFSMVIDFYGSEIGGLLAADWLHAAILVEESEENPSLSLRGLRHTNYLPRTVDPKAVAPVPPKGA